MSVVPQEIAKDRDYVFNPHRHVKIWLSADNAVFMNQRNQLRLIRMRHCCPGDSIIFFYDASLLLPHAVNSLHLFCEKHQIIPIEVQSLLASSELTKSEQKLVSIYQDQVSNLESGGNLGAASDALRWLSPIYKRGTYTDFDVEVNTRDLPTEVKVGKPLLICLGTLIGPTQQEHIYLGSDILSVLEPNTQEVVSIQEYMANQCTKKNMHYHNLYPQLDKTHKAAADAGVTPREWCNLVQNSHASPTMIEDEIKRTVIYSTGPGIIGCIFSKIPNKTIENIQYYSFSFYPTLHSAFRSGQPCVLRSNIDPASRKSDFGWLPSGHANALNDEKNILDSACVIKSKLRKLMSQHPENRDLLDNASSHHQEQTESPCEENKKTH